MNSHLSLTTDLSLNNSRHAPAAIAAIAAICCGRSNACISNTGSTASADTTAGDRVGTIGGDCAGSRGCGRAGSRGSGRSCRSLRPACLLQALLTAGVLMCGMPAQAMTQDELVAQSGFDYQTTAEDRRTAAALNKARQRSADMARRTPLQVTNDSQVRLVYGSGMHTVLTTPLHLTAIVLEPGEQIISMDVGARDSWSINRTVSGSDQGVVEQVIIKPYSSGMHTNMLISTDRRMYHLTLKSTQKDYMPLVSFIYPQTVFEDVKAQRDLLSQRMSHSAIATESRPEGVDPAALDFAYEINGDRRIQPLRVFNDGLKTYIKMPEQVMKGRLPALVVVHSSSMLGDDEIAVTNYRIRNGSFVVDGIPDHVRLILGNEKNGSHQSVDITRS